MPSGIVRMTNLTQKRLKEVVHYDPLLGVFTWNKNGKIAGYKSVSTGYIQMKIDRVVYMAHRLAWLYVYGYTPEHDIDHINRNKSDNSIFNLRHVSRLCNQRNVGVRKDNKTGVRGISFDKATQKWKVQIRHDKQKKYLGYYKSFDDAVCARLAGEQCIGWLGCDMASTAYKYVQENIIQK